MAALTAWMIVLRAAQLFCSICCAGFHGVLAVYWGIHGLSSFGGMITLELMSGFLFIYSLIAVCVQHTGKRSTSRGWLINFIVWDFLAMIVDVALLSVLAEIGLQGSCLRSTTNSSSNPFASGIESSAVSYGVRDELERYCYFEDAAYFLSAILLFAYMVNIVLSLVRMYTSSWISKKEHYEILSSMEAQFELDNKLHKTPSFRAPSPVVPQSEGIASHQPSLRSTSLSGLPRRKPVAAVASSSNAPGSPTIASSSRTFRAASPIDEDEITSDADAHHVADGLLHTNHMRIPPPTIVEEERTADDALVSDGIRNRPNSPLLPPYSSSANSSARMLGHGDESNEIRLSDYVKGETRAQNMKESGGY